MDEKDQTDRGPGERRPYEPPQILSAEPLEATAGFCDDGDPTPGGLGKRPTPPNNCAPPFGS